MERKQKARKAEIARLRDERGATDPILILLFGGSFAVSGFIANAHNLNAKGDLYRIATAQAAFLAQNDRYGDLCVGPTVGGTASTELQTGSIGFTLTAGNNIKVATSAGGWVAVTKSASGTTYLRTSAATAVYEVPATVPTSTPTSVTLPSGITWGNVQADITAVRS